MEKLSFYSQKKIHYVEVVRTKNRNMYLKIKDSKIIVTAPNFIDMERIKRFVSKNIDSFVDYLNNNKKARLFSMDDKFIYIDGVKLNFKILTGFDKKKVEILNGTFYAKVKLGEDEEVLKLVKKYLKDELAKYIVKRQEYFRRFLNVPHHEIRVRYKTSNWGTNMIGREIISYSSRLTHFDKHTIDYVIVHELSHYHEPNHSKKFWEIVEKIFPDYKEIREKMREDTEM